MVDVSAPIGVEVLGCAVLHPAGEPFIEPQIIPPCHRDQIAEPLVRHLMRLHLEDRLAIAFGRDRRIVEQDPLKGEDCSPILHCAKKLGLSWTGYILELGQRIGRSKIVVIVSKNLGFDIERRNRLGLVAPAHGDRDLGASDALGDPSEVTGPKKQQIARHQRSGRESDAFEAPRKRIGAADRHVADRPLIGWDDRTEVPLRFIIRFVPIRDEGAGVSCFELREQRTSRGAVGCLAVEREEAVGLLMNDPGIFDVEPVAPRRQRGAERQRRGFVCSVSRCHAAADGPCSAANCDHSKVEFLGVEHEPVGRLNDVEVDRNAPGKSQPRRVGRYFDAIMAWDSSARQLRYRRFDSIHDWPRSLRARERAKNHRPRQQGSLNHRRSHAYSLFCYASLLFQIRGSKQSKRLAVRHLAG